MVDFKFNKKTVIKIIKIINNMKKQIFKTGIPLLLLIIATLFIGSSCTEDDPPEAEGYQCNYAGYSTTTNTYTNTPETDLTTDFFSSSGPEVEIYLTSNGGAFNFSTTVVTLNATGTGLLQIGSNTQTVNVTCHKAGNAVGEEFWFEVTGTGIDSQFCVIIDQYH